jgi:EAL domain-containing protein (putative c-di-GMP-specific phosphodiesterase class I)/ActR/RegA family two-component response regulator
MILRTLYTFVEGGDAVNGIPVFESESKERHAFIVDDEPQVLTFITNVLGPSKFIPHQFTSAKEIAGALGHWTPDIIVLDLSLGDSDAIEVIRKLSDVGYKGYVLLISGRDQRTLDEVQQIAKGRGLTTLPSLRKPFRVEELRARLDSMNLEGIQSTPGHYLKEALKNNWLELWYQPKIDLRSMLMCGAEGLIRLRHPEQGMLAPGQFLPPAGDSLYRPLSDYVVQRSLADWVQFARKGMFERLAVNVPASVLEKSDFVENVRARLPQHPNFPGLIVEITEDEAIGNPDLAREIAVQLKLYDVHVSIDDFGTGFSSIARLDELPFSEIKLDRQYVHGCSSDTSKREMCKAVADLATRFKIPAVAEGVETTDDLRVLKELGYPLAQGYLFAKPMSGNDFVNVLRSRAT